MIENISINCILVCDARFQKSKLWNVDNFHLTKSFLKQLVLGSKATPKCIYFWYLFCLAKGITHNLCTFEIKFSAMLFKIFFHLRDKRERVVSYWCILVRRLKRKTIKTESIFSPHWVPEMQAPWRGIFFTQITSAWSTEKYSWMKRESQVDSTT